MSLRQRTQIFLLGKKPFSMGQRDFCCLQSLRYRTLGQCPPLWTHLQKKPQEPTMAYQCDPLLLLPGDQRGGGVSEERHTLTEGWRGHSGRSGQYSVAPGAFEEPCLPPAPQRQGRAGSQTIRLLTHTEPSSFLPRSLALNIRPVKSDLSLQLVKVLQSKKGLYDN